MPTSINTYFPDYEPTLTSNIRTIEATTDKPTVAVSLTRDPDGEIDTFYSTTLHSFNGHVEFSDVGILLEEQLRKCGHFYDSFEVNIDGVSIQFVALYCDFVLDQDFDPYAVFFTAAATSVVHRNSEVLLAHLPNGSNNYKVKVAGLDKQSAPIAVEGDFTRVPVGQYVSFSVQEIIDFANAQADFSKISAFGISFGSVQKICFIAEHPYFIRFKYLNMFNAPEFVDVVATVTRKTSVSSSTAECSRKAMQYDRSTLRTYQVQTAALTYHQARELEQLISSYQVKLCSENYFYDILITDHSCEVSTSDSSLTSFKFTFRMADNRPTLWDSEMGHLLPPTSHIFTHQFTDQFS